MTYQPGDLVQIRHEPLPGVIRRRWTNAGITYYDVYYDPGNIRTVPEESIVSPASDQPLLQHLIEGDLHDPTDFDLRVEAQHLDFAFRFDPNASLSNSRLEIQEHQVFVAHRIVSEPVPRFILADEVGLGKTIEAGLVIKELRARGVVKRILILAPPGLISQWKGELERKFHEDFVIYRREVEQILREQNHRANVWTCHDRIIASTKFATYSDDRMREIVSAGWDLVIIDEAHHARKRLDDYSYETVQTNLYSLAEQLREATRCLLLLTATPMQIHDSELHYLVQLIDPTLFPTLSDFRNHLRSRQITNRILNHLRYYDELPPNVRREFVRDYFSSANTHGISIQKFEGWLANEAIRNEMIRSVDESFEDALSNVLIRNRKRVLGISTERKPSIQEVRLTPEEQQLYGMVSEYLSVEYSRSFAGKNLGRVFLVIAFQKMLVSSPAALRKAILNRVGRLQGTMEVLTDSYGQLLGESDEHEYSDQIAAAIDGDRRSLLSPEIRFWEKVLKQMNNLGPIDSKASALLGDIQKVFQANPNEKVLIFTQFLETQDYLREILSETYKVEVFHGSMSREAKDRAVQHFRENSQIMISTEAGSEGRNFQFCHILVNYDLPWNPMKIEQRIGRLDRIGQTKDMLIFNYQCLGTIEERIVDVLHNRIRIFQESVGALDPILEGIEEEFEHVLMGVDDEAFRAWSNELEDRIQRQEEVDKRLDDFLMDRRSFRREKVVELMGKEPRRSWRDLQSFTLAFLDRYIKANSKAAGTIVEADGDGRYWLHPPDVLRNNYPAICDHDAYNGTFDPSIALTHEDLHFFAFGHAFIDVIFEECLRDAFPGLVTCRRVFVEDPPSPYAIQFNVVMDLRGLWPDGDIVSVVYCWPTGMYSHHLSQVLAEAPSLGSTQEPPQLPTLEELEVLWQRAKAEAMEQTEERFSGHTQKNEELYEQEKKRWEGLFRHWRIAKEADCERLERQIARARASTDREYRQIIPAWEGQLRLAQLGLRSLDSKREDKLKELQENREVSRQISLLSVAFVELQPQDQAC